MADLVVGHDAALLPAHDPVFFLLADQDLLDCFKQVFLADILAVGLDGVDGRLVDHIGQVGTDGSAGGQGDLLQVDGLVHLDILGVDLEDGNAALEVGPVHDDAAVETAGPQQGLVQDLWPVGGPDDQDALRGLEAVHLGQELVEGLLPLLVAAPVAGVAAAADGVDLIDKDNAGRVLVGLLEEVAHTGGAHTDIELYEIRAGQGKEGDVGLARDRLGQQGLAGSGRSHQQGALGQLGADLDIAAGVVEEVDDFDQGLLGLVLTRDILEGDAGLLLHILLGRALAHVEEASPAPAHPAEEDAEQPPHQKDGEHIGQQEGDHHARAVGDIGVEGDLGVQQPLGQGVLGLRDTRVEHGIRILEVDLQTVGLHIDLRHLLLLDILYEFIVGDLSGLSIVPEKIADAGEGNDRRQQQDKETLPVRSAASLSISIAVFIISAVFSAVSLAAAAVVIPSPEEISGIEEMKTVIQIRIPHFHICGYVLLFTDKCV